MWASLAVEPQDCSTPASDRYLRLLRDSYSNGAARFASFQIPQNVVFDWYMGRRQFHDAGFFKKFWTVPEVAKLFPEPLADLNFFSHEVFHPISPLLLSGTLAAILHEGGAYDRVKDGVEARDAAEPFARHLLGEDYTDSAVYTSYAPWSRFFHGIAWDYTWVIYRPDLRIVHCIAATDTD